MSIRAIVIKKQNTNEYDQLLTFYSEEFGRFTAVAKSILKPASIQSLHLDVFNLVEFDLINGRAIPIITGAQAEKIYPKLKSDLAKLSVAYFFAEAADRLFFDYQKDDDIWSFFYSLFDELEKRGDIEINSFFRKKQLEFLNILGYAPDFEYCSFCGSEINGNPTAYSPESRGVMCKKCFFDGRRGIVIKDGDLNTGAVTGIVFEGAIDAKMHSMTLVDYAIKQDVKINLALSI